jgi:RNA polymerase sigma factor (sigma-70 family)
MVLPADSMMALFKREWQELYMEQTDHEVLLRCRKGDEAAWTELLNRYERLVYSIPLTYGLSAADAADIVQLTFLAFLESMHTLREHSNLGGWFATVTRRQTWRVIAQQKREGLIENIEVLNTDPASSGKAYRATKSTEEDSDTWSSFVSRQDHSVILWGSEADWIDRWEKLEWIQNGLRHLQERCRKLLTLLYFDPDEPDYNEISARLQIKVGSIGPTRARCLERLKEFMRRE